MRRAVIGFEKDGEGYWVTTEEGRAARVGTQVDCKRCDEARI
jgi:hypothetical protein